MGTKPRRHDTASPVSKETDRDLSHWAAIDRRAAALAAVQHRAIATRQLVELGMTERAIRRRVERGWLVSAHRGVYWLGGPAGVRSYEMAAVLALGKGAFLSHLSAAYLHEFLPYPEALTFARISGPSPRRLIDVSTATRKLASRPGIRVRRATRLVRGDVRMADSIPVSSPARTLIEIAATAPHLLDDAYDEAVFPPRSFNPAELNSLLARFAGLPGAPALRTLHHAEAENDRSRRAGEKRMRALIGEAGLPRPKVNAPIGPYRVDFLWPAERVVLEMDGFTEHGKRRSFEADRARDADLQARGYRVIRVTWRQLTQRSYEVVARIAAVLARSGI